MKNGTRKCRIEGDLRQADDLAARQPLDVHRHRNHTDRNACAQAQGARQIALIASSAALNSG